jgi:MFS family permease
MGNYLCARLVPPIRPRSVMTAGTALSCAGALAMAMAPNVWAMGPATALFGAGLGMAVTAAYTAAATVIPAGAHGLGFGALSSASLTGMAVSPMIAGLIGAASIRTVFVFDAVLLLAVALAIWRKMV